MVRQKNTVIVIVRDDNVKLLRYNTNKMGDHMKDIHEVKDNQLLSITSPAGVWQLEPKVCIYSMDRKGGAHKSTILILKEAHSPWNFDRPPEVHNANSTAQPGQHQKAHNDMDDIPPHNPLLVWVEPHNLSPTDRLSSSQTAHHSLHLINWLNRTGRPLPGKRSKVTLREGTLLQQCLWAMHSQHQ